MQKDTHEESHEEVEEKWPRKRKEEGVERGLITVIYYNNNILKGATEQDSPMPLGKERGKEKLRKRGDRVRKAISAGGKPKEGKSNKRDLRGAEERKVNSHHLTFPLSQEKGKRRKAEKVRNKKG